MYLAMMGMFTMVIFAVGVLAGAIWLLGSFGIEYEYIITNNEMDIDKIIGRRKRKRMITVDFKRADKDAYYLVVTHNDYGRVKIIFNPNERLRESIMQEIPNTLRIKLRTSNNI